MKIVLSPTLRNPFFAELLVNLISRGTFHFRSLQSTKCRSNSQTNTPWNFILRPTIQPRSISSCANRYWQSCGIDQRKEKREREDRRVARFERRHLNAERRKKERNNGSSWHVSRLSVFTEIPCTLHPITFVTDYSKVSHRARIGERTETYPDKLHRANRQCSQMELRARRLFKSYGFHDRTLTLTPVGPVSRSPIPRRSPPEWSNRIQRVRVKRTEYDS